MTAPTEGKVTKIGPGIAGFEASWGSFTAEGKTYKVDRVYVYVPGYHSFMGKNYAGEIHFTGSAGGVKGTYVVLLERDDLAMDNGILPAAGWEGLLGDGFFKGMSVGGTHEAAIDWLEMSEIVKPGKKYVGYHGMMLAEDCGDTNYYIQMEPSFITGTQDDYLSIKKA